MMHIKLAAWYSCDKSCYKEVNLLGFFFWFGFLFCFKLPIFTAYLMVWSAEQKFLFPKKILLN